MAVRRTRRRNQKQKRRRMRTRRQRCPCQTGGAYGVEPPNHAVYTGPLRVDSAGEVKVTG